MTTEASRSPSEALRHRLRHAPSFQLSVDTGRLALGLSVAEAALAGGVDIVEMGTPLLKFEGVHNVVPAFRRRFPGAVLLADMKTMDGGAGEAEAVFEAGANIIDFLALAGVHTARAACRVRDAFQARDPDFARLCFADILLPHQGPAGRAADIAEQMLEAGVDGIGIHLQVDARVAETELMQSDYFNEVAAAVFARAGDRASVQVVGGLSIARAAAIARHGLRAFVISGNMGEPDGTARFSDPPAEITARVRRFIGDVGAAIGS